MNTDGRNAQPIVPYDIFILIASILSLYPAICLLLPPVSNESIDSLIALDWIFSTIFMIDFVMALTQAPDKRQYLKWGWIDFLGSLPAISIIRPLRLVRVVRVARIMHRTGIRNIINLCIYQRAKSTLWLTAALILFLLIVSSILILRFEQIDSSANIKNEYDALWWSFVTMSTVGYGDHYPITKEGRNLAMILMVTGVIAFGILTSYLASNFLETGSQERDDEFKKMSQELTEIKALLYRLDNDIQLVKEHRVPQQKII